MNLAFVIDFVVEMSSAQMVNENHILRLLKLQEKNKLHFNKAVNNFW